MKKILFTLILSSLLSSGSAFSARYQDHYYDLDVEFRNFGADNCQLTKKILFQGSLISSDIPSILAATGERYNFKLRGEHTEAQLTYQCGEYKKFTVYMHQFLKPKYIHVTIDARMMDAVDVFEKHQTVLANHRDYKEHTGKLSWQIYQ